MQNQLYDPKQPTSPPKSQDTCRIRINLNRSIVEMLRSKAIHEDASIGPFIEQALLMWIEREAETTSRGLNPETGEVVTAPSGEWYPCPTDGFSALMRKPKE